MVETPISFPERLKARLQDKLVSLHEALGETTVEIAPGEWDAAARLLRSGVKLEVISAGGERRSCLVSAAVLPNGSGIEGTVRDISQRLKDERQRLKLMRAIHQAAEAVVVTDAAGLITYVNPAFEQITGYRASNRVTVRIRDVGFDREETFTVDPADVVDPDDVRTTARSSD